MNREKEIETRANARIVEELTAVDVNELFDNMVDECSEPLPSCISCLSISQIMRAMLPVDYRCGVNDYIDGLIGDTLTDEIEGNHYDKSEADDIIDEVTDEVDAEIEAEEEEAAEAEEAE